MNFADLIKSQVTNAFTNILAPGGLTKSVSFHYMTAAGVYDPVLDTATPTFEIVPNVAVVAAKPTFDDTRDHGAVSADVKLIVPGPAIPRQLETETDKVTYEGDRWEVKKCVGVPGEGVWIVFICRT